MLKTIRKSDDWADKSVAEQGFTLIELLVVIAILGILAVVGALSFNGLTDGAQVAVNETEAAQVSTAADAYKALNNTDATSLTDLDGLLKDGAVQCSYDFVGGVPTQTSCPE